MDKAYLHLLVNHFSIVLAAIGALATMLAMVMGRRSVWLYALATLTLAGIFAYPTMLTGHGAEDVMEKVWYVSRDAVHAHEEAADIAMWVTLATGVFAALAWWRQARAWRDELLPGWMRVMLLVLALASAGGMGWASWQAGFIVHKNPKLLTPPPGYVPPPTAPSTPH
jgi:hypothetical protein